jgi:hypothetical protein
MAGCYSYCDCSRFQHTSVNMELEKVEKEWFLCLADEKVEKRETNWVYFPFDTNMGLHYFFLIPAFV